MFARLKPISQALCLLSLSAAFTPLFAATNSTTGTSQSSVSVAKMAQQEKQLEQQMQTLQAEMQQLQQEQASLKQGKTTATYASAPASISTHQTSASHSKKAKTYPSAYQQNVLPATVSTPKKSASAQAQTTAKVPYGGETLANIGGFAVITSPYLHPAMSYNGGDLIVNFSSINKDVAMMQQRQAFQNAMASKGFGMPSSGSLLELSGEVEGDLFAQNKGMNHSPSSDLYVGDAELDMQAIINRWLTAYMNFSYDNSPNEAGNRVEGNIVLDNGFFTLGDLNKSLWRMTVGQLYVPFGQFNSFLVSDPLNKTIFRTKAQPIIVGYGVPGEDGFAASLFTFRGDSHSSGNATETNQHINQYGADANYQFKLGAVHSTFGASYIANMADSNGMQGAPGSQGEFQGFGNTTSTEYLQHEVPAVDLRAMFDIAAFTLIGEYDTATEAFNAADLSFDGEGATPSAYHLEGVYSFTMMDKPSSFALGYDRSYEALALNLPQSRVAAALNTSPWRNTLASLELRHDTNYSSDDTASGSGAVIVTTPEHAHSNAVTIQFQVFF